MNEMLYTQGVNGRKQVPIHISRWQYNSKSQFMEFEGAERHAIIVIICPLLSVCNSFIRRLLW